MICHDCTRRHKGCHQHCIDYKAFVETLSQRNRGESDYACYLAETKKRILDEYRISQKK